MASKHKAEARYPIHSRGISRAASDRWDRTFRRGRRGSMVPTSTESGGAVRRYVFARDGRQLGNPCRHKYTATVIDDSDRSGCDECLECGIAMDTDRLIGGGR